MVTPEDFLELARRAVQKGLYEYAVKYYEKAVEGRNVEAMTELADLYRTGTGVTKDMTKALSLLTRAAFLGDGRAMNKLGVLYSGEDGVKTDAKKSFEWCRKAAAAGNLEGMYNAAYKYMNGDGVTRNLEAGVDWLIKAAQGGYPPAMYDLAGLYEKAGDLFNAFTWRLRAATSGHVNAMNDVGYMYSHGVGVERNPTAGMAWYKLAAHRDNLTAIKNLAYHYSCGVNVEKNFDEAVYFYERAIVLGDEEALNELGDLYLDNGNFEIAAKYYQQAVEKEITGAMVSLALMFLSGQGVQEDYERAVNLMERAAISGNVTAMAYFGFFLTSSEDSKKLAEFWLRKAARADSGLGMKWLADLLAENGKYREAEYWYYKAIELNVADALKGLVELKNKNPPRKF